MLVRNFLKYLNGFNYFDNHEIIHSEKNYPKQKALFAFHPHGIFCISSCLMGLGNKLFDDVKFLGTNTTLFTPGVGLIYRILGQTSVDPDNFKYIMK